MDPAVRAEYDAALGAVTLCYGSTLLAAGATQFSNYDWALTGHAAECETRFTHVEEDTWHEFAGTFASTNATRRHGVRVTGVTCACGALVDRTVRREATVSEVAEAVFTEAFRQIAQLRSERKNDES